MKETTTICTYQNEASYFFIVTILKNEQQIHLGYRACLPGQCSLMCGAKSRQDTAIPMRSHVAFG